MFSESYHIEMSCHTSYDCEVCDNRPVSAVSVSETYRYVDMDAADRKSG